jgi:hypothetical protein
MSGGLQNLFLYCNTLTGRYPNDPAAVPCRLSTEDVGVPWQVTRWSRSWLHLQRHSAGCRRRLACPVRCVRERQGKEEFAPTIMQELQPLDMQRRLVYCQWFESFVAKTSILDVTWIYYEAWLNLSGHVNTQNTRTSVCAAVNPHVIHE